MFKLSKKADYGLIAVKHLALHREQHACSANEIAEEPGQISALDVISAIDGPVLITSCVTSHGNCDATEKCSVREPLRRVNESILNVLSTVTISQMSEDPHEPALVALSAASRPHMSST